MSNAMSLIDRWYGWFICVANSLQSPLLLVIRLYWGWQFWQAGWGKLTHIAKATAFFTQLGIPAPALNAHFVALLETAGGILLIFGLLSRPIAFLLTVDMIVAFVTADREALGFIFSNPEKFYAASPYTCLFASLLILVFGPGKFSVDYLIARCRKRHASAPAGAAVTQVT